MDSKIELDANSESGKNLITKQVREGKIKYYFLKKFGTRLTIKRYLAHQNIPNIIVFLNFWPTIVWQWKGQNHRVPDCETHDPWATVSFQSWVGCPIVPLRIHSIHNTWILDYFLAVCVKLRKLEFLWTTIWVTWFESYGELQNGGLCYLKI